MNSLLIAVLAGLGSMFGWGISDFFAKRTVDKIGDKSTFFWVNLIGWLVLIIPVFLLKPWVGYDFSQVPLLIIFGFCDILITLLFYMALQKGKISIISPINATYPVFAVLISIFFFNEVVSPNIFIVLVMILIGLLFTALDIQGIKKDGFDRHDLSQGVPLIILQVVILSVFLPFWDQFLSNHNWLWSMFLTRFFSTIIFFVYIHWQKVNLELPGFATKKWVIGIALFEIFASVAFNWGYGVTTHTSIVTVLSAAFFVPTLLLGRVILKEKLQLTQWLGVGLILLSLIALGFI